MGSRLRFQDLLTSVRNGPAINVFTRTKGPNAFASASVIAFRPAFAAAYGTMSGAGRSDPAVLTLMIEPRAGRHHPLADQSREPERALEIQVQHRVEQLLGHRGQRLVQR